MFTLPNTFSVYLRDEPRENVQEYYVPKDFIEQTKNLQKEISVMPYEQELEAKIMFAKAFQAYLEENESSILVHYTSKTPCFLRNTEIVQVNFSLRYN